MRTAYLDCFSGVSGDMLLGALLDVGLPEAVLREVVAALRLNGVTLEISRPVVQGFAATRVQVHVPCHDHEHHHAHRHLAEITTLLDRAGLEPVVRARALAVFTRLAAAEAAVHGTTPDRIHFHEVGADDAMVDIVGTVAGLAWLGVDRLVCSPLPLTSGWVACAHGEVPLPAPAVCRLLADVPVYGEDLRQELVTPTGAALVRELAAGFGPLPPLRLERTGYGAGMKERSDGRPNLLRLLLGDSLEVAEAQRVEVLETHLDDWNPEFWPYLSDRLMAAGALDVCLVPMHMKKGRPGFLLRVITAPAATQPLIELVFRETTAIGLRRRSEERVTLERTTVTVATPWGPLAANRIQTPNGPVLTPEYEACRAVAERHRVPLHTVYAAVRRIDGDR
jgi:uncharacterized protein (TIGR00299 family) protein